MRSPYTRLAAALVCGLSTSALAEISSLSASFSLAAEDTSFNIIDSIDIVGADQIMPGTVGTLGTLDSFFGPDVEVTFDVSTVGNKRTILLTYETVDGSAFVTPDAVGSLMTDPAGGFYVITFGVFLSDTDWDGGQTTRTAKLYGDGMLMVDGGSFMISSFNIGSHGFADITSPAEPGFFGSGLVADAMTYEISYTIVPAPAGLTVLAGTLGLAARRRR